MEFVKDVALVFWNVFSIIFMVVVGCLCIVGIAFCYTMLGFKIGGDVGGVMGFALFIISCIGCLVWFSKE